jgi:hypothetical protein
MAEGHWQLGDGVDFPFGSVRKGEGRSLAPNGEGRGQGGKYRQEAQGESDFPSLWGHYIKNQR